MKKRIVIQADFSGLYTLVIVLLPWLGYLKSPLPIMNMGTFVLFMLAPFIVLDSYSHRNETKGIRPLIPYLLCITIQSLFYSIFAADNKGLIPMLYMWFTCVLTLHFGLRKTFDINRARVFIENFGLFLTFSVLLQHILYLISGRALPLLPNSLLYDQESFSTEISFIGSIPRFGGLFPEPVHFSQCVIVSLASALFPEKKQDPRILKAIIITVGILLTTSGMGLALGVFVWITWYVFYGKNKQNNKYTRIILNLVVILIVIVFAFCVAIQFNAFQAVIGRIFGTNYSYSAIQGRSWAYYMYQMLPLQERLLGVGYGFTPPIFMASIPLTLYTTGVVGLGTLAFSVLSCVRKTRGFSREICVVFVLMLFFTGVFNQRGVAFFYSFIIAGTSIRNSKSQSTPVLRSDE